MYISKLELKNINSYGNNLQTLEFDNNGGLILLVGDNGTGKCLLKGTKVRMFDGTLKKVENIKVGDILIGPDSKKRTVTQLYNGKTKLYKIHQNKGIDYVVTHNHLLSLKECGSDKTIYITPLEYLNLSKSKRKLLSGHISNSIEYENKDVFIDPYILGVWLCDGNCKQPEITNIGPEIISEIYKFADKIGCSVVKRKDTYKIVNKNNEKKVVKLDDNNNIIKIFNSAKILFLDNGSKGIKIQDAIKKNYKTKEYKYINDYNFRDLLKKYNLLGNKHIPRDYMINSKNIRLSLLAGIIDTDGYVKNNYISITQKSYILIKDIEELCNSLGYKTSIKKIKKGIKDKNFQGIYWNISISGNNLQEIPLKVKKKNILYKNKENKDKNRTGISIEYYGIDEYFGFTLKEDPLFLLEDYTVTHNSTIKQSLELCLFGKVQGKSGKRLALNKLPNRRNGSLYTGVYFKNQRGDDIVMKRFIQPNNFEMYVNEEPYTERFKIMSEKDREKLIGYSFEVFKSFISLNMNDFKNFISLSKEDKENLLNKLFNLNDLDVLFSITKDLDINNQKLISELDNDIYRNEQTILEYKQTIQNIKITQQKSKDERLSELKQQILLKKPIFQQYEEDIKSFDKQKEETNKKLNKLIQLKTDKQKEKTKLEVEIETLKEKIEIFNKGICPMCDTDLTEGYDAHIIEIKEQIENKEKLIVECNEYLDRCILEDTKIRNAFDSIYNKKSETQNKLSELRTELSILHNEYTNLKEHAQDNTTENLETKINILKETNRQKNELLQTLNKKSQTYEELKKIFSDDVRKSMIKNALIPINKYLNVYLTKLNSEYQAQLNENFDANIFELGILNIDPETLSKGEDKKINIAIALSYLNLVLDLKQSNIMFLDEIFDGIDINNINLILNVLREIALKHKINIIIVNHGMEQIVDIKIFDKVIRTTKDIFSNIEIINELHIS